MDKKELEMARSVITSALTPNNKTGMTAAELDEEIYALMGERLKLPSGCPNLEAFILRYFADELIGTPTYGGTKYRLIPKADTDYLLKLVARQNDRGSKPLYVAEQAREAALRSRGGGRGGRSARGRRGAGRGGGGFSRGGSSTRGRNGIASTGGTLSRFGSGFQQPPRLQASHANSFINGPSRPTSSMDWVAPTPRPDLPINQNVFFPPATPPTPSINISALQKVVQQAVGTSGGPRRPASAMAGPPPLLNTPIQKPVAEGSSKELNAFKEIFDRYKVCKESGLAMEVCWRLTHSKTKLATTDFPTTIEELRSLLNAVISQCESQPKSQQSESTVNGGTTAPVLAANAFPPVGHKFLGTLSRLDSFDRFFVQTETGSGKKVLLPCALYGAVVADAVQAAKVAKDAIASCENKVNIVVKAHKPTLVEVDLFHVVNGASLISYLSSKGLLFMKPSEPSPIELESQKVTFKLAAVAPTSDKFIARVSAVMMVSIIAVNAKSNIGTLIEIENALAANVNTKSKVRREEVVKSACFIIRTSQYCRARVITTETSTGETRLRLIDHGSDVTISSIDELFQVPNISVVVDTPPLAFYLDLHNLQHHFFQKESCTVIAERELLGKTFEVDVTDRSGKRPQVNLFEINPATGAVIDASVSVNKKIKENILAEMSPKLEIGKESPVLVRFIDWNNERGDLLLHLQIVGFGFEVLASIEQALPAYYEPDGPKPVEKSQLSLDQEYVAPYQGCFYRCNLLSTEADAKQRVLVLFYDYGNVESVPVSDLRVLEEKYTSELLSNQAILTRLSGLPLPGKQWVSNASELVFSTFDSEGEYLAKAIAFDQDDKLFEVEIRLPNGECVNEKFAKMPELFEDQKVNGSTFDSNSVVSKTSEAKSSEVSTLKTSEAVEVNVGDQFAQPVLTLPPFDIVDSFDSSDNSVNACVLSLTPPGSLSCQLYPNDEFNKMIMLMNDFYAKPENRISPVNPLKPGDCGVVYADGCYCRAQVQNVGKYTYKANFVDYAVSNQVVKHSFMFLLEARFAQIKPMGFELKLTDVTERKYIPPVITEYAEKLAEENPIIKIYPADKFKSEEPCDAVVSVSGRAVIGETGVNINAHIAQLLQ